MRVLVTGSSGQLGRYLIAELTRAKVDVVAWSGSRRGEVAGVPLQTVDLVNSNQTATEFTAAQPSIVIHAAARASVADCHRDPDAAYAINVRGTRDLARFAADRNARFVYVSTDLVFDGEQGWYKESDVARPLSVYGRTKAEAERIVIQNTQSVVARVSLLYGPARQGGVPSFFDHQIRALRSEQTVSLFEDEWRTPLDLVTAARALIAIAKSDHSGYVHVGGPERLSRLEMGRRLARFLGVSNDLVVAARRASAPFSEPRPRDCSLDSARWRNLFPSQPWPSLEEALAALWP